MWHTFDNRRWRVVFASPGKGLDGLCELDKRQITIRPGQSSLDELTTIIHEGIHADLQAIDEDWVQRTSEDIASLLWKMGWRKE